MPHKTPEERAAYQRAYRERNREALAAKKRARRAAADPAVEAAYMKDWYSKNKERHQANSVRWYSENRLRHQELGAAWRKANPESHRVLEARRRAKASAGSFTLTEWTELLEEFDHRCAYCQGQGALQVEHMTPLSRGGLHDRDNVVPACGPCNRRKYTANIFEFLSR